jgi:hypothetical protein
MRSPGIFRFGEAHTRCSRRQRIASERLASISCGSPPYGNSHQLGSPKASSGPVARAGARPAPLAGDGRGKSVGPICPGRRRLLPDVHLAYNLVLARS